jgi:signal transduction histidine kinase
MVTVADNGPGIAPDQLPHIFESFFTTKKSGTGLGLAIAKSIIEIHKGKIWAENRANGGAAVHFTLPATRTLTPATAAARARPAQSAGP